MSISEDIKNGGIQGCLGLDQMDWGGQVGQFYEFWKCAPQCGGPDLNGCLICCGHWWCCNVFAMSSLYSKSLNQECHLIPHCAMVCFCTVCTCAFTRYNVRRSIGMSGNLCGDFVCAGCCGSCSFLQVLRASKVEDWNYFKLTVPPTVAPEINFVRHVYQAKMQPQYLA